MAGDAIGRVAGVDTPFVATCAFQLCVFTGQPEPGGMSEIGLARQGDARIILSGNITEVGIGKKDQLIWSRFARLHHGSQ